MYKYVHNGRNSALEFCRRKASIPSFIPLLFAFSVVLGVTRFRIRPRRPSVGLLLTSLPCVPHFFRARGPIRSSSRKDPGVTEKVIRCLNGLFPSGAPQSSALSNPVPNVAFPRLSP